MSRLLPLAALVAVALVAAVPALAIVVVWPLLFAVPGWFLVSRIAPGLPVAGRTGLAIVTSVYLSAHLEGTRDQYYALLQRVRTHGEWGPWLLFFVEGR